MNSFLQNKESTEHSTINFRNVYGNIFIEKGQIFACANGIRNITMHLSIQHVWQNYF